MAKLGQMLMGGKVKAPDPTRMPSQDEASRIEEERRRLRQARTGGRASTDLTGGGSDYSSGTLGS